MHAKFLRSSWSISIGLESALSRCNSKTFYFDSELIIMMCFGSLSCNIAGKCTWAIGHNLMVVIFLGDFLLWSRTASIRARCPGHEVPRKPQEIKEPPVCLTDGTECSLLEIPRQFYTTCNKWLLSKDPTCVLFIHRTVPREHWVVDLFLVLNSGDLWAYFLLLDRFCFTVFCIIHFNRAGWGRQNEPQIYK